MFQDAPSLSNDYYTDQSYIPLPNLANILPWVEDPQKSQTVPGLDHTQFAVSDPPLISTLQEMWKAFKEDPVEFVKYGLGESYEGTKDAVQTVVKDVVEPIQDQAKTTYWYILLAVVVVAGGIYFIGKGGAIKANVNI